MYRGRKSFVEGSFRLIGTLLLVSLGNAWDGDTISNCVKQRGKEYVL